MSRPAPLFIQPLLGPNDAWGGYRVACAGTAAPELLSAFCASPLLAAFDARHLWCLPAPDGQLPGGRQLLGAIPASDGSANPDELAQRIARLRAAGHLAGVVVAPGDPLPKVGQCDYLLIGASHARSLPPFALVGLATHTPVIATETHSHADRRWLRDNDCRLCSGEYVLARNDPQGRPDITRLKLLKLLALIVEDAATGELEAVFREEPKLSYSLLRLVNSVAVSPRSEITSFAQAINLLGRQQLQRWIQLLVYADPNNGQQPNPLLQKAAQRGRLLELLAGCLDAGISAGERDIAFMIGTFSLLDVLLNLPMPEILRQLPLPTVARQALEKREGWLGTALDAIDAADRNDLATAERKLGELPLDPVAHLDAQLQALAWAAKIQTG